MNVALSEKDRKFREFALEGSMWKVIWKVCYPLAIYQSLNQLFKILDTMMAAHISANAVSTVAYLSQINLLWAVDLRLERALRSVKPMEKEILNWSKDV